MPSHVPPELKLEVPVDEEDISDLSPYAALPLSTNSVDNSSATFSARSALTGEVVPLSGKDALRTAGDAKRRLFDFNSANISASPSPFNEPFTDTQTWNKESEVSDDVTAVVQIRRWIIGIAVVEFDIDTGPSVESLYPPLVLHPAEAETLAFCAFPDSVQFEQGSQTHSFRIREQHQFENRSLTKDGFIYGFSHFMQRRDPASKRGYQQRSLVILTQLQYPALFSYVVSNFGPWFEAHGTPMLEAACRKIATWPDPDPGRIVELGFLGSVLHVEIPHSMDVHQVSKTSSFSDNDDPKIHILATTAPFVPPPLLLFEAALANLWSIWECLVLCEPILIFGTSAAQTSQAIWWLRDLLRPLPFTGDIRPYFTMQDSESPQLVNKLPPKAGLLLGVTNPFFEKSCVHWPHVLSLGRRTPSSKQNTPALGKPAGPPPGWKTRTHKRYISKDRVLLKQLESAIKGSDRERMDASFALRRHFCSRSAQLITPVARYLNSLIPSPSEVQRVRLALYPPAAPPSPSPSRLMIPSSSTTPSISTSASRSSLLSSSGSPSPTPSLRTPHTSSSATMNSPLLSPASSSGSTPTQDQNYRQASTPTRSSPALRLKSFNNANFFASLKAHGSVLPFKSTSKRTEFYERWLRSPAFGAWLAQQEQIVQRVLNEPSTPPTS